MKLSFAANYLLDLLFPIVCQDCGTEGTWLCLACQTKIQPPTPSCLVCRKNSFLGQTHERCTTKDVFLTGLLVVGEYKNQGLQNLVWNLKYNSVRGISETLGLLLADFFIGQDLTDYFGSCAVVPVPLHKRRTNRRGFNQAELIAREFCRRTGLEFCDILKRTKDTSRQVDLEKKQRAENVKGAFSSPPLPSFGERKIILIDDVATTSATLNECARVLHAQKPAEIWGLVVARN